MFAVTTRTAVPRAIRSKYATYHENPFTQFPQRRTAGTPYYGYQDDGTLPQPQLVNGIWQIWVVDHWVPVADYY
jgi:hypothetical protein